MQKTHTAFEAIGTRWDIYVNEPIADDAWSQLLTLIHARIDAFDKAYSRFRADSLVTKMSRQAGTYELLPDGHKLLALYEKLYEATAGKITPLIGQTIADAGYDATYSFEGKPLHQPPRWEDVLSYDETRVTLTQPALLDFGAAGKGYLVDIVSELIEQASVRSYLINAGGDILHRSAQNEAARIGLENPFDTSEAIGVVELANKSLCASSGSKRKWQNFHHIIDPTTLKPAAQVAATWVLADDTLTADGLATALFFVNPKELLKHFAFSYVILSGDMHVSYTKGFPVTLFEATA